MAIVGPAKWAHAVRRLEPMALGACTELRKLSVDMAAPIVPSATRNLFLGERAHQQIPEYLKLDCSRLAGPRLRVRVLIYEQRERGEWARRGRGLGSTRANALIQIRATLRT